MHQQARATKNRQAVPVSQKTGSMSKYTEEEKRDKGRWMEREEQKDQT